jgi:5'-nucleotidase
MRILLTNDDGIYAPGLRALLPELQKLGEVTVIAPATEQSAAAHSITLLTPLISQEVFDEKNQRIGWAVEGRPADCVKLALVELLPQRPDLIVSGVNSGSNAGINVLYSGTVAAAIEGAFFGVPSVAVSLEYRKPKMLNFPLAADLARQVVEQLVTHHLRPGMLFNVNIPSLDLGFPKAIRMVPQSTARYHETYDRRTDPRGRTYYWISANVVCPPEAAPETDVKDLANQLITVTPLKFDLTDWQLLKQTQNWEWQLRQPGEGTPRP